MRRTLVVASLVACMLFAASTVLAAGKTDAEKTWTGSIPVEGKHSAAELNKMATVPLADAEKAALAAVEAKDADKKVKESEIEVEHGCLVYSFDIQVAGKKGIEEVIVDAGTGKVLWSEHESPAVEVKEKREEARK